MTWICIQPTFLPIFVFLWDNGFIDYLIKEMSYHEDPFIINYLSILNSWPCAPIMRIIYAIYLYVFDTRIPLKTIYSQTLKATKGIREASIYLCPWLHIMAHWDLCPRFLSLQFLCNCKGVYVFKQAETDPLKIKSHQKITFLCGLFRESLFCVFWRLGAQ